MQNKLCYSGIYLLAMQYIHARGSLGCDYFFKYGDLIQIKLSKFTTKSQFSLNLRFYLLLPLRWFHWWLCRWWFCSFSISLRWRVSLISLLTFIQLLLPMAGFHALFILQHHQCSKFIQISSW